MLKYSNNMVFFVIQGRNFEDIYSMTKARLEKSLCYKELSNIPHTMHNDSRQNVVLNTNAMLSSSTLLQTSEALKMASFPTSTKKNKIPSSEKCLTSSSSKNNESYALRENFIRCNRRNELDSTTKSTVQIEKILSIVGSTTNLQKAKRQISF